ncbi:MAG: leucine-rich repeat domain-containing protein [Oscillospiraceae bacterium]|nr:leucine-rich repeat domain-containing protein [Oscillospiraceae bacterium]
MISIGGNAFYGCTEIRALYLADLTSWLNVQFADSSNYYYSGSYPLASGAKNVSLYVGGELVQNLVIPEGVTIIPDWAFCNCVKLESVHIPASVITIGRSAFNGCVRLTTVFTEKSNNSCTIGSSAFYGCVRLKSVVLPTNLASISDSMFYECGNLEDITIPDSTTAIGSQAFYHCSALASMIIPSAVTAINSMTFSQCTSLAQIQLPNGLKTIGQYAFNGCSSLNELILPDSIDEIGEGAFSSCASLTSISIPNSISCINRYAFRYCNNVTEVAIPVSITEIYEGAFSQYSTSMSGAFPLQEVHYGGTEAQWLNVYIASGNEPLTAANINYNSHIHSIELRNAKEASCTEEGYTGDQYCTVCGKLVKKGEVIPKQHKIQLKDAKSATVLEPGYTGDEVCSLCGKTLSKGTVIPRLAAQNGGIILTDSGTPVGLDASSVEGPLQWLIMEGDAFAEVSDTGVLTPRAVTAEARVTVMAAKQDLEDGIQFVLVIEPANLERLLVPSDVDRIAPGAFAGSQNLKSAQIPDSIMEIGDGAFTDCSDLTISANPGTAGAKYAEAHGISLLEYPDGRFALEAEYLLLRVGQETQMSFRNGNERWKYLTVWTSSDSRVAAVDSNGAVKAVMGGTAFIRATINESGTEYAAECRVDVLDESAQGSAAITASLPVTKVTAELLKTDYARVPVVLTLKQNDVSTADMSLPNKPDLTGSGVAITEAEFIGGGKTDICQAFGLRIADDRNLELVPIIDVTDDNAVKQVAGSYKSAIRLKLNDGTEITTSEITVTVKKSKPKLTVKPVTVNGFVAGQTVPVEITGGKVTSIAKRQDLGFAYLNTDLTVTVKDNVTKSGKATVNISCQPDDWAVSAALKFTVNNKYVAPKVTFSPASLTLNPGVADIAKTKVQISPLPGMSHIITVGSVAGLNADYDSDMETITVTPKTSKSGNYTIPVKADGKTVVNLKVKVKPATTDVSLSAKASGAIDTTVPNSPVIITLTGKNFNASAVKYQVLIVRVGKDKMADDATDLFNVIQSDNIITITGTDKLKNYLNGYTYTAHILSYNMRMRAVKVNLKIKASEAAPAMSATLKAAGSIDILRGTGQITVTPTIKNVYNYEETDLALKLPEGLTSEYRNGRFIITAVPGANINPNDKTVILKLKDVEVPKAKTTLQLKQSKVTVSQNTKAIVLSKNDRYDRQSVILSLSDSTLYEIGNARVSLTGGNGAVTLIEIGNGEYAIGYAKNKRGEPVIPSNVRSGKLKSTTVKLNVYLQGNGGKKADASLSVKVSFA